jgi:hypothetical protein
MTTRLDHDTLLLYKVLARRGSDWVKKRLCPKEAAQFAIDRHFNVARVVVAAEPQLVLPDQASIDAMVNGSWDNVTPQEDDGEPQ